MSLMEVLREELTDPMRREQLVSTVCHLSLFAGTIYVFQNFGDAIF